MAELAPTKRDLEWVPPRILVHMAGQSRTWAQASGFLSRIDHGNATSKDLEIAGDICREHSFYAKAIEFYGEAAEKDPENLGARVELLALSAEFRAAERNDALRQLQILVVQSLGNTDHGGNVLKRYLNMLDTLGRYKEMADFCEAQLKQAAPREIQAYLHRNLA